MFNLEIFCERMQKVREEKGLTMKEAGNLIGVTKVSVHGYEHLLRKPSLDTLIAISRVYNVSVDYLLGKEIKTEYGYISNEEFEFIKMIRKTPKLRKIISENPKRIYLFLLKRFGYHKYYR